MPVFFVPFCPLEPSPNEKDNFVVSILSPFLLWTRPNTLANSALVCAAEGYSFAKTPTKDLRIFTTFLLGSIERGSSYSSPLKLSFRYLMTAATSSSSSALINEPTLLAFVSRNRSLSSLGIKL